jgi:hypothetical protein
MHTQKASCNRIEAPSLRFPLHAGGTEVLGSPASRGEPKGGGQL